jgi:hypothetical protein
MNEREPIGLQDTVMVMMLKMAEGNPGAITAMSELMRRGADGGVFDILSLDDMNIRGTQIWVGYSDYCGKDIEKFAQCIKDRDKEMIAAINREGLKGNHEALAVQHGGSSSRVRPKLPKRITRR